MQQNQIVCFATSAIFDDRFVMCCAWKLTPNEVAAKLPYILGVHLDTLSY